MIIHRMTATFGTLQGAALELEDGLNLIYAPNEGGKSTWCAFLRTMLYGFPQRERDKKGAPADKNRYRPWNGGAMEGLLDCTHQGARILLRRFDDQGIPMGGFSAVYADTGDPVAGLTGENVGEVLTGVGREVFERTVFLRQTHLSVDPSTELEQRIAALLSSGDEQVSWSQAENRLRQWQRDRRYHKSGQLIALEEEAAVLERQLSQVQELHRDYLEQEETVADLKATLLALEPSPGELSPGEAEAAELSFAEAAAELDAATLQLETLEAERALRARFSPTLNQRTAGYFSALTGGAYETVTLDRAFSAQTEARDSRLPRSAAQLSRGAADQLYMALRLALCDLVLPAETHCPIVLDDALINFDDTRLAYALELLTQVAEKRQVLLFTCHRREQAYFEGGAGQLRQTMIKKSRP